MSFKILYGLCEEQKSEYIFNLMQEVLKNKNNKLAYLVPEQFSFYSEEKIAKRFGYVNNLDINVLSFKGLAAKVFAKYGPVHLLVPGEEVPGVLMRKVMLDLNDKLSVLGGVGGRDAFSDELLNLVQEFQRYNVGEENLDYLIKKIENEDFQNKIEDIKEIFSGYNLQFEKYYKQSETVLKVLKSKIQQFGVFGEYCFIVDRFNDFTEEEIEILEQIMINSRDMFLCLTCDSLDRRISPYGGLFNIPIETAERITALAEKNNIEVMPSENFQKNEEIIDEIDFLGRNFFNYKAPLYDGQVNKIKIFTVSNNHQEVEILAAQILKLVREDNLKFSDILIAARDLHRYIENIKYIFPRYSIPFIIDHEKSAIDFEIPVFFLRFVNIFSENFSIESLLNYLKSPYSGVERNDLYIFENYCISKGIGRKHFLDKNFSFECYCHGEENIEILSRVKLNFIDPLVELWKKIKNQSTRFVVKCLYNFVKESGLEKKIGLRIKKFHDEGKFDLCLEIQKSYDALVEVIDSIYYIFGDSKSLKIRNFYEMLKSSLSKKKINLSLFSDDHVRVSNIDLFRSDMVKCFIVLGAVDENLPKSYKLEGILTNKEREFFSDNSIKLSPSNKIKQFNEDLVIYKCLTTARDYLFFFVPLFTSDGAQLLRSPVIDRIKNLIPSVKDNNYSLNTQNSELIMDTIESLVPSLDILVDKIIFYSSTEKKEYGLSDDKDKNINFWRNLAYWYDINYPELLDGKLQKANYHLSFAYKTERLNKPVAEKVYDNYTGSVSKIEQYIRCPFAFFVKYILKIREQDENIFTAPDIGLIMHEAIERFFLHAENFSSGVDKLSRDAIFINSLKIAKQVISERTELLNLKTSYLKWLENRVSNTLYITMSNVSDFYRETGVKPLKCEFQFNATFINNIEVSLDSGEKKNLSLQGKIDRVDILNFEGGNFIGIADYKTGKKRLSYSELLNGIGLQLPIYLKMVCDRYKSKYDPMYMLYYNLDTPLIEAFPEESDNHIWKKIRSNLKMNGVINEKISTGLKSSGDFISLSRQFGTDKFKNLFNFVEDKVKQSFKKMLDGDISVYPCMIERGSSCLYCKYRGICGFGSITKEKYRYIQSVSDGEFFENILAAR